MLLQLIRAAIAQPRLGGDGGAVPSANDIPNGDGESTNGMPSVASTDTAAPQEAGARDPGGNVVNDDVRSRGLAGIHTFVFHCGDDFQVYITN